MARSFDDAVYGSLIAGAAGDALGAPVEGWHFRQIREKYGRVTELMPYESGYALGTPGSGTDDSNLRYYLSLAIAEKGGRITPDDLGRFWCENVNPKWLWTSEHIVTRKLKAGMDPWETGRGNVPAGCASMAIAPIGIINAGNPDQAYQDAMNIASVNQDGMNRDAAASIAAGQAAAFLPGATVARVLQTMQDYSSPIYRRAIDLTMDLAENSADVDEFAEKFYGKMLDWTWPRPPGKLGGKRFKICFSGNSHEFVPVVMAILHLCGDDLNRAIIEGASFGRDCDTIATIVGNLAGTIYGASMVKPEWIETCEKANEPFFEQAGGNPKRNWRAMADELIVAVRKQQQRDAEQVKLLATILGN